MSNKQDTRPQSGATPMSYILGALPKAATDVIAERKRQIEGEQWSLEHDDKHDPGELASAAACYAVEAACKLHPYDGLGSEGKPYPWWPWDQIWWKPKDPRRDLVRAAALIIAEIERIDRTAPLSAAADLDAGGQLPLID